MTVPYAACIQLCPPEDEHLMLEICSEFMIHGQKNIKLTASCLHFCGARWPEGDRLQLTHVAMRCPAN